MNEVGLKDDLDLAITSARAAGRSLLGHFGRAIEVRYKTTDQPVTPADLEADGLLREALLRGRPEYGWVSEEMSRGQSRTGARTWVVDPLDGTANFIAGRGDFAVCLGLLEAGEPVLGVIHHPTENVTYWARTGGGSFRNGERIEASAMPKEGRVVVVSYSEAERGRIASVVDGELLLMGSTALKMMRVAEGHAHLYVSTTRKGIWDICAGSVIVAEAGGHIADLSGAPPRYEEPRRLVGGLIVAGRGGAEEIGRVASRFESETHD